MRSLTPSSGTTGGLVGYGFAVLAVAVAALVTWAIYPWLNPSISLLFFPAVLVSAMFYGYGPAMLSTLLSTLALALIFVPSLDIGIDDLLHLGAFTLVALAMAWISAARKSAEDALRLSLRDLERAISVLRQVREWPSMLDADSTDEIRGLLQHAAGVVGASDALVMWEVEEEPWVNVASTSPVDAVTQHRPDEFETPQHDPIVRSVAGRAVVSAGFQEQHLSGRMFFIDLPTQEVPSAIDVVSREMGNSLERHHLARQMRLLAVSEERIRLARDLHDGVLQSLTGIRLQLQALAETVERQARDQLLAIERALAIEQRELRLFIDSIRSSPRPPEESRQLADGLEEMRARLEREWKTPISIRVTPATESLRPLTYRAVRLMIHEAIVNALKHGHPSRVSVAVQKNGDALRLVVQDDGRGFAFVGRLEHPALVASDAGPSSLRDRVSAMGGTMTVESSQSGASVEILLPV
jgi:signal transduction histidine kinase